MAENDINCLLSRQTLLLMRIVIPAKAEYGDSSNIKINFLRAMYRYRSLPCPMGTARAEDPLGKGT